MVLSHMGHMMASIADAKMAGKLGTVPQAAVGLSDAIYAIFVLFGIGISVGITPLVAKAASQRDENQLDNLYKHGMIMNLIMSVILTLGMLALIPLLIHMKQTPEVIAQAKPYYILLASSIIFSLIFFHFKQFGEGIHLVRGTMWVTIWGNLLNIFLNFVFIEGWFGVPQMGITGIGIATLISRIVMMIALIISFKKSRMRGYIEKISQIRFDKEKLKDLFRNCIPVGFQYILEMAAFSLAAIMSGWFGPTSIASHYVAIKIASVSYLIAAGLSSASAILVGNAYGEKDWDKVKILTIMSTKMVVGIMATLAVVIILGKSFLTTWFNPAPDVIALSSKLLIIAAIFQLCDGLQVIGMGVLRWKPLGYGLAYWRDSLFLRHSFSGGYETDNWK